MCTTHEGSQQFVPAPTLKYVFEEENSSSSLSMYIKDISLARQYEIPYGPQSANHGISLGFYYVICVSYKHLFLNRLIAVVELWYY